MNDQTRSVHTRRSFIAAGVALAGASLVPRWVLAQTKPVERWLLFTKSSGFLHDVTKRAVDQPSIVGARLAPMFAGRGIELVESKDGRLFEPEAIKTFAGFVFFTTGDLTAEGNDRQPPMSVAGKQALLDVVGGGVPFIGLHSASDTFHDKGGEIDPYTTMLGAEFDAHGDQQRGRVLPVDSSFALGERDDWVFTEEWYAFKNFSSGVHIVQTLETANMQGDMYRRDPYPITWTRMHGRGRVFYTAMGHREDVIASPRYGRLIGSAIDWCRRSAG